MAADLHPHVIDLHFVADNVAAALHEVAQRPSFESIANAHMVVQDAVGALERICRAIAAENTR